MDAAVSAYSKELDYNPCLECKLCVATCPVGAIGADGAFNFSACYTHNYREFMGATLAILADMSARAEVSARVSVTLAD